MILIATTNEFRQFKIGLLKDIQPFSDEKERAIKDNVETLGWFKNHKEFKESYVEYPNENE